MFKDPIYRRLFRGNGGQRYPLFQGHSRSAANCLIIESNVDGITRDGIKDPQGRTLKLRSLANVPAAAKWLREELPLLNTVAGLGDIKVLNSEEAERQGTTLAELVK